MSAPEACVRGTLGVDAEALSDAELSALVKDLTRRQRERQRIEAGMSASEAINLEAAAIAKDLELAAKVEKRNAYLNILKRKEAFAFVDQFGDSTQGLEALLTGSNRKVKSARGQSVDARYRERHGRYLGGLISELKREGVYEFVNNRLLGMGRGVLDDKIAIELYELRDGGSPGRSGSREAQKVASIIHKYQELARADQNRAGAFIRKMQGYIVAQSHDMLRIARAGKQEWIRKILPLLDAVRTFDGADPVKYLSGVYDELSTGVFHKADSGGVISGFKGPANLAKKVSQSRVLHFKGAEEWSAYNAEFGMGSLMEAVSFGLGRAARNVALMDALGPNPRAMFDKIVQTYEKAAKQEGDPAVNRHTLSKLMDVADGTIDIPGSMTIAGVGQSIRTFETITKLGGATLSSLPDIATQAAALNYQGKGFLSGLGSAVSSFFAGLPKGSIRREVAERIGSGIDASITAIASRVSAADTLPGRNAKLQQMFFRLNLLSWWTDAQERGFTSILASDLGKQAGKAFDALGPRQKAVFAKYGIGAPEWEMLRQHALWRDKNGGEWLMPEMVRDAPDSAFHGFINGEVKPGKIAVQKDRLESALRSYYLDRTSFGVLKGGIRERYAATLGLRAGTGEGEAVRLAMQFKSYSIGFVNKVLGQFTEEDKFTRIPRGLYRAPLGDKAAVAKLILATTVLGYISLSMKQIAKGQEPRDPTDLATWGAAMVQGGGAGIYGDFLTADYNRFGGGGIETIGGPAVGLIGDAGRLYGAMRDWASGKTENAPDSQAFNIFKSNTPFLNLFYVRAALDYLILYDIQEALSPGSLKRMERRMKKEQGREFLLSPSKDRLTPVT